MKTSPWNRDKVIAEMRERIWLYLTPTAVAQQELCAAALLQMDELGVAQLARQHFLLSDEVGALLDALPRLVRQLPTQSMQEDERSTERIRGAVRWQQTLLARHASGQPTLVVSQPSNRVYLTPENQLLVFLLGEIPNLADHLGWSQTKKAGAGTVVHERVATATRWSTSRMLAAVPPAAPTPRALARIRSGRQRRRFAVVIDAYCRYQELIEHVDRAALREAIEQQGLSTRNDATLFELLCWFNTLDALIELGWTLNPHRLIQGRIRVDGTRGDQTLSAWYQHGPTQLTKDNRYGQILVAHSLNRSGLIPDIVVRHQRPSTDPRWLLVESKMGTRRTAHASARAALLDLLGYENAYAAKLAGQQGPIGLGVAWGQGLTPTDERIMLSTPENLGAAYQRFLDS